MGQADGENCSPRRLAQEGLPALARIPPDSTAALSAASRLRVSRAKTRASTGVTSHDSHRGRAWRWYRNATRVRPGASSVNRHDPANDRTIHGPRVILIAVTRGGLNETYSVSIPSPLLATQYARTPTPGAEAPPTSSADRRNGS